MASPAAVRRRDWYWLRSFIAGGVAGCCAKTTIAPLDRVKILLQAHNHHYKHLGVFSTLCAVPKKEGYLGLYKGNGAMMIRIFPYGAIQFMAFDRYKKIIKKQLGISGHVHRLMAGSLAGGLRGFYRGLIPTVVGMAPYAGFSFFTFGTLKSIGLAQAPNLLGRPSLDNPDVLVLKTHVNLLCGGIAGAIAQTISCLLPPAFCRLFYTLIWSSCIFLTWAKWNILRGPICWVWLYKGSLLFRKTFSCVENLSWIPDSLKRELGDCIWTALCSLLNNIHVVITRAVELLFKYLLCRYPLDVTRRRMQLGAVLPDSEKCLTMVQTLKYVYQQHGVRRGLYRGLSLNYIRCIPSQAVAFTTYELMKQLLHLN
ncbi:solute carrier family 25 member 16 isoform X2 [Cuculus canorus]|uniref:solute carrier family 25 member 16 isoform X2 n=1 Tax=Cuculus canorus TaxID=55661 RepID=UPI0023AA5C46|nr:solute carrier family 25 member 16 isoform X2 [Cuculus canorus]